MEYNPDRDGLKLSPTRFAGGSEIDLFSHRYEDDIMPGDTAFDDDDEAAYGRFKRGNYIYACHAANHVI